ncbi:hypothetical protein GCM10017687_28490 [Streptomyces echinatus]
MREALTKALHGTTAQVSTGDARGPVEFLDAAAARTRLISMGGAMGGTSLLVAILVVVGTFALTVQQRHRELAVLRAIAATPGQIRKLLGREALIVGAAAGTAGALLGLLLGSWLHSRFVALGAVPETLEHTVSVFPPLAALAATLLGAWAAARIASRRIVRIRPAEALAEARAERTRPAWGRIAAGLLLLAGGVVLVVVLASLRTEPASTPVTFLAVIVLSTSVALLGPLLVKAAALLLAGPLRLTGHGGRLAIANLRGNAARMASVVTPLALLVGMTCTVLFVQATLGNAARTQAREGITADWVVAAQGVGVPGEAAERLRARHDTVTEVVRTTVRVGLDKYVAQGVTPAGLTRTWGPGGHRRLPRPARSRYRRRQRTGRGPAAPEAGKHPEAHTGRRHARHAHRRRRLHPRSRLRRPHLRPRPRGPPRRQSARLLRPRQHDPYTDRTRDYSP